MSKCFRVTLTVVSERKNDAEILYNLTWSLHNSEPLPAVHEKTSDLHGKAAFVQATDELDILSKIFKNEERHPDKDMFQETYIAYSNIVYIDDWTSLRFQEVKLVRNDF